MGEVLRCLHCARVTALLEAGARFLGWRIYRGTTMSGREMVDVVCPVCSGRGPDPGPPTWDVVCLFCKWRYTDGWTLDSTALTVPQQVLNVIKEHNRDCQAFLDPEEYLIEFDVLDPNTFCWMRANSTLFVDMIKIN